MSRQLSMKTRSVGRKWMEFKDERVAFIYNYFFVGGAWEAIAQLTKDILGKALKHQVVGP